MFKNPLVLAILGYAIYKFATYKPPYMRGG